MRANDRCASKNRSLKPCLTRGPLNLNGIHTSRFNSPIEVEDVQSDPEQRQSCASRASMSEPLASPRARAFDAGAAKAAIEAESGPSFVNGTELTQRGGCSPRGDGANGETLRSLPLTHKSKDIQVQSLPRLARQSLIPPSEAVTKVTCSSRYSCL